MKKTKKTISIITPCFNEELNIELCYKTIKTLFEKHLVHYEREHIFCDNNSSDKTTSILRKIAHKDRCVKIIINARNFGILKNTFNGVLQATGNATFLFLPADLQDPPELIPEFVKKWEQGYEIVYGIRAKREESIILAVARKIYYEVLSKISIVAYPPNVGDFQLIDRKVLNAMKGYNESQPFMRIMTFDCGFRSIGIKYTWKSRKNGFSKNSIYNLFEQGLNGLISFSNLPIRFALFGGFIISFLSFIYAFCVILISIFKGIDAPKGILTIITAQFIFGGIQLFFTGILGEYILAIFNQVRQRPLVVERERINFKKSKIN